MFKAKKCRRRNISAQILRKSRGWMTNAMAAHSRDMLRETVRYSCIANRYTGLEMIQRSATDHRSGSACSPRFRAASHCYRQKKSSALSLFRCATRTQSRSIDRSDARGLHDPVEHLAGWYCRGRVVAESRLPIQSSSVASRWMRRAHIPTPDGAEELVTLVSQLGPFISIHIEPSAYEW